MSATTDALSALLALPAGTTITVQRIETLDWGAVLVIHCEANRTPLILRFADCRDLRWRAFPIGDARGEAPTPVVDFAPGRDQHRSPAQLLTSHFGLSLVYGSLAILR